ncbi:MAG TPA: hypothetical protein VHE23_04145, partial [Candidatus Acidoferrales bacterium]|nr:hypothetical protein [Candidatus Acidoferrales bacterium]
QAEALNAVADGANLLLSGMGLHYDQHRGLPEVPEKEDSVLQMEEEVAGDGGPFPARPEPSVSTRE